MHDEFLHRLRKEPSTEFAARLQAQLRRQSKASLPSRAPSQLRTLITVLLLGGTAFALTSVVMRGLPGPVVELYQQAASRIATWRGVPPAHESAEDKGHDGLWWWGTSRSGAFAGAARHSRSAHPARATTGAPPAGAVAANGDTSSAAPVGEGHFGLRQIPTVSSWAAYPYAVAMADRAGTFGALLTHIDVSVAGSDDWLGSLCRGGPHSPDLAYTFAPVGTVSDHPCPRSASGAPSPVVAIPIGQEAVVLARSPLYGRIDLTRRQVFLALAKWVPDPARSGIVHANSSRMWRQIDPSQGLEPIQFIGPPLSSAAGRSMIELLMQGGCDSFSWIAALKSTDPHRYERICRTVRTDGVYVEVSVPGLAPSELLAEPNAIGILGFESLTRSSVTDLAVSSLDGVQPTLQSIESGEYPGSRGLYLYMNRRQMRNGGLMESLMAKSLLYYPDWAFVPPTGAEFRAALLDLRSP
jgi:phosphate transport system substrate-binding protein